LEIASMVISASTAAGGNAPELSRSRTGGSIAGTAHAGFAGSRTGSSVSGSRASSEEIAEDAAEWTVAAGRVSSARLRLPPGRPRLAERGRDQRPGGGFRVPQQPGQLRRWGALHPRVAIGLGEQPHRPGGEARGRVEHRRGHVLAVEPGEQLRENGVVVQLGEDPEHPLLGVGGRVRDVEPDQHSAGRARVPDSRAVPARPRPARRRAGRGGRSRRRRTA
jgi:hypothetical protein